MKTLLILLLLNFSTLANICINLDLPDSDDYHYDRDVVITSFDKTKIYGNLLTPKKFKGPYPTIIFPNSWTVEEHEYMAQAIRLAKEGFQVFSYSTRGWGCSEGLINVAGKNDFQDLRKILDWLEEYTPAQKGNFAMAGISYGGGLSLMGLAKEDRIKTVFAMSTWTNLKEALYAQNTPRLFWSNFLVKSGDILGNMDPNIPRILDNVLQGDDEEFKEWVYERSLINNLSKINRFNKPIYLANNFGDNLFQPNALIKAFHKISAPKVLDLSQGSHATAELPGLLGLQSYLFDRMSSWFHYWLKKDHTKKDFELNRIVVQPDVYKPREVQPSFQFPKRLFLHPRSILKGSLSPMPYLGKTQENQFFAGLDSGASTGVPFISAVLDGHFNIPTINYPKFNNILNSLKFKSAPLTQEYTIRGIPRLKLNVEVSSAPYQIIAYLYDVSPRGIAKLITHGAYTGHNLREDIQIELVASAYNIKKGHSVAIILDTQDSLYARPDNKLYKIDLKFDPFNQSYLEVKGWK